MICVKFHLWATLRVKLLIFVKVFQVSLFSDSRPTRTKRSRFMLLSTCKPVRPVYRIDRSVVARWLLAQVECGQKQLRMDNEVLIAAVYNRSSIWDKRDKYHSNRIVVENCWKEISAEMKEDGKYKIITLIQMMKIDQAIHSPFDYNDSWAACQVN